MPEFLHADPSQRLLSLQRLIEGSYHEAPPDASGRAWSAQLGVWFGYDDASFLRIYTRDGEMLLTQEEEKQRADAAEQRATAEAEQRAEAERQLAELRAELERLRGGPSDQA